MGATLSAPEAFPTDIPGKTIDGRQVANEIFRYMLTQIKINEYLTMANTETCKNYVIVMADALEKYFHKVRLYPTRDPTSKKPAYIYFRKITDIRDSAGDIRQYCMGIAYFYVRLFQIYGALAISILDTNTEIFEGFPLGGGGEDDPEEEGQPMRGGVRELPMLAETTLLDNYNELKPYLRRIEGDSDFYKFEGRDIFLSTKHYTRDGLNLYKIVKEINVPTSKGRLKTFSITADLNMPSSAKGNLLVQLRNIEGTQLKVEDTSNYVFTKEGTIASREWKTSKSKLTIPKKLDDLFTEIIRAGKGPDTGEKEDEDRGKGYYGRGDTYEFDKKRTEGWDERNMHSSMRTRELWETMKAFQGITKGQPVKAHCIARALQLVSSRALEKAVPPQIVSSVCMTNFLGAKYPGSLPKVNEEVTKETGIMVLNQLFYDRILSDLTPSMSSFAKARYDKMVHFMKLVFKNSDDIKLDTLKNKTAASFCKADQVDKRLATSDKETILRMRAIVRSMLMRQIEHTAKVVLILKKLFLIEKGKSIQIHPIVLAGGIPVLNKIGEEARELLVNYYVNCEKSYGDGIAVLETSRKTLRVV